MFAERADRDFPGGVVLGLALRHDSGGLPNRRPVMHDYVEGTGASASATM